MDEEKETQEIQETPKVKEQEEAVEEKPIESTALLDEAKAAASRIEQANEEQKKLLEKQEKLMAEQALSGRTVAGIPGRKPEKKTDAEYAKDLMRGIVNPYKE